MKSAAAIVNTESYALAPNVIHNLDVLEMLDYFTEDDIFDMAIIDPPYNIGKDFGNNHDNKELSEYVSWSLAYLNRCVQLVKPSSPIYVYGYPEILAHLAVKFPIAQQRWLSWHYTNKTVPTSKFWQRSYESILCLWKGNKPKLQIDDIRESYTETFLKNSAGKVRKSKNCRYSNGESITTYNAHQGGALPRDVIKVSALAGGAGYAERVFYCKDCNEVGFNNEKGEHAECNIEYHPTQKPFKLTEKLIKGSAPDNILIPFAGSGSECVVANNLGVEFYSTDINNYYSELGNKWLNEVRQKHLQSSISF